MSEPRADRVYLRQGFLAPTDLLRVLAAIDRLSPSWTSSEQLGLLGRGRTTQVRSSDLAAQAPLDEIRHFLAPATLQWAKSCGFWFAGPPRLQLFPVRMIGDKTAPPSQEPHVDTYGGPSDVPVCTNVFYAKADGLDGGELMLAPMPDGPTVDPIAIRPTPNTIATIAGDRVHWVAPLYAGERISIVINLY